MRKVTIYILLWLFAGGMVWAKEPVRVMSFNIRYGTAEDGRNSWKKRHKSLTEAIEQFNPDYA